MTNLDSDIAYQINDTHCFVSSNSFHGQITQKAVHQITDPENKKNVAIDNFLEQTTLQPTVFEQERP